VIREKQSGPFPQIEAKQHEQSLTPFQAGVERSAPDRLPGRHYAAD
jgi:hypothetical protein